MLYFHTLNDYQLLQAYFLLYQKYNALCAMEIIQVKFHHQENMIFSLIENIDHILVQSEQLVIYIEHYSFIVNVHKSPPPKAKNISHL